MCIRDSYRGEKFRFIVLTYLFEILSRLQFEYCSHKINYIISNVIIFTCSNIIEAQDFHWLWESNSSSNDECMWIWYTALYTVLGMCIAAIWQDCQELPSYKNFNTVPRVYSPFLLRLKNGKTTSKNGRRFPRQLTSNCFWWPQNTSKSK